MPLIDKIKTPEEEFWCFLVEYRPDPHRQNSTQGYPWSRAKVVRCNNNVKRRLDF